MQLAVTCTVTSFFGAFAKVRRAIISFFMSVCPSAWKKNPAPTEWILMKFGILLFFGNLLRKFNIN
jgi:hypothetical protein